MVILIAGASHTGKTLLAQRLMEKYHHPYLSIDHLKMGLIRSGQTTLTPMDDDKLTDYLWPIVREMVKTAIENGQNLIVEGCYIPFDWKKDFSPEYLSHIRYCCLIMSRNYIESHFADIRNHGNAIEQRLDDSGLSKDVLIQENERNLRLCRENRCEYILLNDHYDINLEIFHISHCVRAAHLKDMALAADIMVTSFRTAFAAFVSPETMDACTNPDNCRAMLENIYREGKMHFLMGDDQGFLCWQETDGGAEIVAIHSLPDSWGTGLGHAILTEALKQIGDCPVHLWAFKENTRARRFYEKHGFHWDGSERVSEFDGAFEVRYVHSSGEIWDAYCADGTLAGQDLVRGEPPVATALEAVRGQLAQLQLQQENICEYLEKGVYTIDMFTKRNASLTKEIKQLQSAEADLLRQQGEGDQKKQSTAQLIPTTQHILESYPLLSPAEKNRLWKLVVKKATVYRSQDDKLTVTIYPNLPK